MISVKTVVIAQGPTGLEGLAVRAADLSPLQSASTSGRQMSAPYVALVTGVFFIDTYNKLYTQ